MVSKPVNRGPAHRSLNVLEHQSVRVFTPQAPSWRRRETDLKPPRDVAGHAVRTQLAVAREEGNEIACKGAPHELTREVAVCRDGHVASKPPGVDTRRRLAVDAGGAGPSSSARAGVQR